MAIKRKRTNWREIERQRDAERALPLWTVEISDGQRRRMGVHAETPKAAATKALRAFRFDYSVDDGREIVSIGFDGPQRWMRFTGRVNGGSQFIATAEVLLGPAQVETSSDR
jgi:hypothetical protein